MLNISIAAEVSAKFKKLLEEESGQNPVFRIYESKVGGGCKSHMELRVSLDERSDVDEEQEVQVDGIPFVVSDDVIETYGSQYNIFAAENGMPGVKAG